MADRWGRLTFLCRHTDYGTTTLLFSVPVTALQIWGADNKWRYVPYKPGALVINLGETLEGNPACQQNLLPTDNIPISYIRRSLQSHPAQR